MLGRSLNHCPKNHGIEQVVIRRPQGIELHGPLGRFHGLGNVAELEQSIGQKEQPVGIARPQLDGAAGHRQRLRNIVRA